MTDRQVKLDPDDDTEVDTSEIADESITEPKMDFSNSPSDGQIPTWNSTAGRFEWGSISGVSNPLTADLDAAGFDIDDIGQIFPDLTDQNLNARDGRPMYTVEDTTIFVNPSTGNDTNDGLSTGSALKTLREALWRVPWFLQHPFTIDLADGVYLNADNGNQILGPVAIIDGWQRTGTADFFLIEGNPGDPRAVEVQSGLSLTHWGPEEDNENVNGVYFQGDVNNKNGNLTFNNCVFDASLSTASNAIQGKGAGKTHFKNCEFDGVNNIAHIGELGGEVIIGNGCTGTVTDYAVWGGGGVTYHFKVPPDFGGYGAYEIDNAAKVIIADGVPRPRDWQLRDSFEDGRAFNGRGWRGDIDRPLWTDKGANNPDVQNNMLHLPDGSVSETVVGDVYHPNIPDELRFRYQWQSNPSSGNLRFRFCFAPTNGDKYELLIDNDTDVRLNRTINGTFNPGGGALIAGTASDDTSLHEITFTWDDAGNIEIFEDGTSLGSAVETDIPSMPDPWEIEIRNQANADVRVGDIYLGTPRA